jgi:hypothetical protein
MYLCTAQRYLHAYQIINIVYIYNTYKNMVRTFKVTSYPRYFLIVAHLVQIIDPRNLN